MYDLNDAMDRIAAMESVAISALSDFSDVDAKPYWPHTQEGVPYWWNQIRNMNVELAPGARIEIHRYTIGAGLVIGHLTSGYDGEMQDRSYTFIETWMAFVRDHHDMTDGVTYTTEYDYLWIEEGGLRVTGIPGGTRVLSNSGYGGQQHVLLFELDMPLLWLDD